MIWWLISAKYQTNNKITFLFENADWREEFVHQRAGECSGEERVSVTGVICGWHHSGFTLLFYQQTPAATVSLPGLSLCIDTQLWIFWAGTQQVWIFSIFNGSWEMSHFWIKHRFSDSSQGHCKSPCRGKPFDFLHCLRCSRWLFSVAHTPLTGCFIYHGT